MYIKRVMEDSVLQADEPLKATLIAGARQTGKFIGLRALFPTVYCEKKSKTMPNGRSFKAE